MGLAELGESNLLEQGIAQLTALLGRDWHLQTQPIPAKAIRADALLRVGRPGGGTAAAEILIEAQQNLTPAQVDVLAPRLELSRREISEDAAVLVIAPWLSPRTRRALEEQRINYLDLTGNASISLREPTVLIRTEGAQRDPRPAAYRPRRGLTGSRAGRVIRELVDFAGPRRANELVAATGISESYMSRLLDVLSDEALIQRRNRQIIKIDWQGLLRVRASTYQLMRVHHVAPALMRTGRERTLDALRTGKVRHRVLATGSFAARGFAPTAVGGALMFYVEPGPDTVDEVANDLELLRIDQLDDAEVLLLHPTGDEPLVRPHPASVEGVPIVGLSQLVLDCLSGPGRLPAEGEAVLDWMANHVQEWRRPSPLEEPHVEGP